MPPCLAASYYSLQRVGSGTGSVRFLFPVILPSKNSSDPLLPFLFLPKPSLHSSLSILHPCRAPFIPLSSHTLSLSIHPSSQSSLTASLYPFVCPTFSDDMSWWLAATNWFNPTLGACSSMADLDTAVPLSNSWHRDPREPAREGERRSRDMVREGCMYLQE